MRPARRLVPALILALASAAPALGQGSASRGSSSEQQVDVEARAAGRQVAAARVVPLLKEVRRKASGQVTMGPGNPPDSPFTGTQTTLFSMSVGKREPASPDVLKALDRMLEWNQGDRMAEADARLFDAFFDEVTARALALGADPGTAAERCDEACVLSRLTTLDERWGPNPRQRAGARDQLLLDAVAAAVEARK